MAIRLASHNIEFTVDALGASLVSVTVPDINGTPTGVLLSPDTWTAGGNDPSYSGRTVAPCCGRIRNAEVFIGNRTVKLSENEGRNHIHGGISSAALCRWETVSYGPSRACFRLFLPDGLDGYPGNRTLEALYEALSGTVSVRYSVTTDRRTWFDCTNHAYWDLGGRFDGSALDQTLWIPADKVVYNGEDHIPLHLSPAGGALDFRTPKKISCMMSAYPDECQLKTGKGYNNAFVLREDSPCAARLYSPLTGIGMSLYTDQASVVLYTGGFLNDCVTLCGRSVPAGAAVALEAQSVPDCGHLSDAGSCIVLPGEKWSRSIRFSFKTDSGS